NRQPYRSVPQYRHWHLEEDRPVLHPPPGGSSWPARDPVTLGPHRENRRIALKSSCRHHFQCPEIFPADGEILRPKHRDLHSSRVFNCLASKLQLTLQLWPAHRK